MTAQNQTESRLRSRMVRAAVAVSRFRVVKQGADASDFFRQVQHAAAITDVPAGVTRNAIVITEEGSIGQLGEFPIEVAAAVAVGDRLIVDNIAGIGRVKPVGGTALPYWTVGIARSLQGTIGGVCQVEWAPQYFPAVPALDGDLAMNSITAVATVQGADLVATDDLTVGDDAAITGLLTVGETLGVTGDTNLAGNVDLTGAKFLAMTEMAAPAAPAANKGRLFLVDSGAGKTILKIIFATGAAQTIATEP